MSTHIVDCILAIKLPPTLGGEPNYLIVHAGGSSNCFDHLNRRESDWYPLAFGWAYSVIGRAVRFAADCEGGMTKLYGRDCSPESMIRAHRKAIAEALTLEQARDLGILILGNVRIDLGGEYAKMYLEHLEKTGAKSEGLSEYGRNYIAASFDLYTPEGYRQWDSIGGCNCMEDRIRVSSYMRGAEIHKHLSRRPQTAAESNAILATA